jgi:hypothetical protein
MSVYAAIDLHSNNSVLAVLDETDRVLRQRRLPQFWPACRSVNNFTWPFNFGEDRFGRGGPHERLAMLVVVGSFGIRH